jgi:hypothetical protein
MNHLERKREKRKVEIIPSLWPFLPDRLLFVISSLFLLGKWTHVQFFFVFHYKSLWHEHRLVEKQPKVMIHRLSLRGGSYHLKKKIVLDISPIGQRMRLYWKMKLFMVGKSLESLWSLCLSRKLKDVTFFYTIVYRELL